MVRVSLSTRTYTASETTVANSQTDTTSATFADITGASFTLEPSFVCLIQTNLNNPAGTSATGEISANVNGAGHSAISTAFTLGAGVTAYNLSNVVLKNQGASNQTIQLGSRRSSGTGTVRVNASGIKVFKAPLTALVDLNLPAQCDRFKYIWSGGGGDAANSMFGKTVRDSFNTGSFLGGGLYSNSLSFSENTIGSVAKSFDFATNDDKIIWDWEGSLFNIGN